MKRLKVGERLRLRLRDKIAEKVAEAGTVKPYAPEQPEPDEGDGVVLTHPAADTAFAEVSDHIAHGDSNPTVEKISDLDGTYAYAVELTNPKSPEVALVAFRKLQAGWTIKKAGLPFQVYWTGCELDDSKVETVFRVDAKFDFFHFDRELLILERKEFERGLNFKRGLQAKSAAVLAEFQNLELFVDLKVIEAKCLGNMRYLRRLATIEKAGHFRRPGFLDRLAEVAKQEAWEIEFCSEGKLVVTDDKLDAILSVLADHRLKSLLTDRTYDADSTKVVGGGEGS